MYTEQEWELDQKRRRADEWSHLHQTSLEWEQEEERYYEYKRWETEYFQSEEEIEEKFDQFGFVFMGDPPHMNRGFLGNLKVLSAQGRAKGFHNYILFHTGKWFSLREVQEATEHLDVISVEEGMPVILSFETAEEARNSPIGRVIYSPAYWKWTA